MTIPHSDVNHGSSCMESDLYFSQTCILGLPEVQGKTMGEEEDTPAISLPLIQNLRIHFYLLSVSTVVPSSTRLLPVK